MKLRLTESDLHRLISSAVNRILKESYNDNEILSNIVQSLNDEISAPEDGEEGNHKKQISLAGLDILLEYEIDESGSVYVYPIEIYGEEGKLGEIFDNGMVSDAIVSLTACDQNSFVKNDPTFNGGGFSL